MTPDLVRFIQNTQHALRGFSAEQLYQLALSLAADLARRGEDAQLEAHALVAALLPAAVAEHQRKLDADLARAIES